MVDRNLCQFLSLLLNRCLKNTLKYVVCVSPRNLIEGHGRNYMPEFGSGCGWRRELAPTRRGEGVGVEAFFVEEEDAGAEGEERAAKAKLEIRN
jgi:hypothetical protein